MTERDTERQKICQLCENSDTATHTDTETAKQTEISDQSGNCRFLNFDSTSRRCFPHTPCAKRLTLRAANFPSPHLTGTET